MYSIKPGRGPSLISAIFALVVGVPFLLFWIASVSKAGAPGFFVFFGVAGLIFLVVSVGMGFYNASARNRVSTYDITTDSEEGDPFNPKPENLAGKIKSPIANVNFCPSCGAEFKADSRFCVSCGKERPTVAGGNS